MGKTIFFRGRAFIDESQPIRSLKNISIDFNQADPTADIYLASGTPFKNGPSGLKYGVSIFKRNEWKAETAEYDATRLDAMNQLFTTTSKAIEPLESRNHQRKDLMVEFTDNSVGILQLVSQARQDATWG